MKIKNLLTTALLSLLTCSLYAQTQVIAHRGYWKTDGSAQNSITSLIKADSIGCYGCEFDVWLAADDQLVVNHDPSYGGKNMELSPSTELTTLQLDNGENLPTLSKYLKAADTLQTRLILELKAHKKAERETEAVQRIVGMVQKRGLESRIEYISFSLHAVKEFIRLAPAGTPVYYLEGDLSPQELKDLGCAGADYPLNVFRKHPEWIEQCHTLGLKVNVWTVNKPADMKWLIQMKADFITTNEPVVLQKTIADSLTIR